MRPRTAGVRGFEYGAGVGDGLHRSRICAMRFSPSECERGEGSVSVRCRTAPSHFRPVGFQARALLGNRVTSSAPCSPTHRPPARSGLCSMRPAGLTRLGRDRTPGAQPWQNRIPTGGRNRTCDGLRRRDGTTKAVRAHPGTQRVRQTRRHATNSGQHQALCCSCLRWRLRCRRQVLAPYKWPPPRRQLRHDTTGRHRC